MSADSDLQNATGQLLALANDLDLGNVRFLQGQDQGTADNYVLNPTPPLGSYGPDVVIALDVGAPNQTNTPHINISSLGSLLITSQQGGQVAVGNVAGKCLFALSSAGGGGYVARLIGTAQPFDISSLPALGSINLADYIPVETSESEGGVGTNTMARTTISALVALVQSALNIQSGGGTQSAAPPGVVNALVSTTNSSTFASGGHYTMSGWGGVTSSFTSSTFNGQTFTVGSGDSGYYLISCNLAFTSPCLGVSIGILRNNVQGAFATDAGDLTGAQESYGVTVVTAMRLNVGDTIAVTGHMATSGSSTRTLAPSSLSITRIL